jgi:hypothetical protein
MPLPPGETRYTQIICQKTTLKGLNSNMRICQNLACFRLGRKPGIYGVIMFKSYPKKDMTILNPDALCPHRVLLTKQAENFGAGIA